MRGTFDCSLQKYNPQVEKPVLQPIKKTLPESKVVYLDGLVSKFKDWTAQIKNINIDHSIDYFGVLRVLEKYIDVPLEGIAGKIAVENWSVSTYNKRLNFLRSFFAWLLDTGVIPINPLLHVSKRREKKKSKNERRKPLTEQQISAFLEAIKLDIFCHKSSPVKHSFYYPFLKYIFITGVRNAEAVGLKVKHIDFNLRKIEISETFARTTKGTHHAARISKGTKTENVRYLPLTDELAELLLPLVQGKEPDDLIFLSPRDVSIDDRMLQRRIIKPVLLKMGFGDRDLYSARHSFGTRAVQQGMVLTDLAYLMGHATIQTAIQNYVNVDTPAAMMPKIHANT